MIAAVVISGRNRNLCMKKLLDISRAFLGKHQEWRVFGITFIAITCWGGWHLSREPDDLRFHIGWDFNKPDQPITLSVLSEYISANSHRIETLKREVIALRGISPASPEEKQLEAILSRFYGFPNTESFIKYRINRFTDPAHRQEESFRHLTKRQQRIIQLSGVIHDAHTLRSKEWILTALAAESAHPTKIEGLYTDYSSQELLVRRTTEGYQVKLGGGFGYLHRSYGYEFMARREGDTLIGKANQMYDYDEPEKQITFVIKFNRGIAEVKSDSMFGNNPLVKLGDLRATGVPSENYIHLGSGACSVDTWDQRESFLRNDVIWNSEARPRFSPYDEYLYFAIDKALGGPRTDR